MATVETLARINPVAVPAARRRVEKPDSAAFFAGDPRRGQTRFADMPFRSDSPPASQFETGASRCVRAGLLDPRFVTLVLAQILNGDRTDSVQAARAYRAALDGAPPGDILTIV